LFNSEYRGGDSIWRNTRYNRNFLFNLLAGKEWESGKQKQNVFGLNARLSFQGGDRIIPLDYPATKIAGEIVYKDERAYEERFDPSLLLHFTINYRINKPGHSSSWTLQVINATGVKEFYGYRMNLKSGEPEQNREKIVVPNLSYKIEF
jgi:hypothetical protein